MNDQTLTAYRGLGAEARNYADPDRALATARRRRRTRLTAAAVLAPLVAGSLAIGATRWPAADPAPPPPAAVSISDPGLLQPPAKSQPLPARAVGPAVLAYAPCANGCDALVVLTDGRQLVVPPDPGGVFAGTLSLSPDGAWLGYPAAGEYLVRDLTGTRVHRLPPSSPGHRIGAVTWSADSTKLLVSDEPRLGGDATYAVLDVATGAVTNPRVPAGGRVVGMLPDGAVLYRPAAPTGGTLTLSTTDGRTFPIGLGDHLKSGETVQTVHLTRDGTGVYVIAGTVEHGLPTAVVSASLTGKVQARQDLAGTTGVWELAGVGPEGVVFSHRADTADAKKTTLVTVSAAGSHQGLVIAGTGPVDGGAPVVRLPG